MYVGVCLCVSVCAGPSLHLPGIVTVQQCVFYTEALQCLSVTSVCIIVPFLLYLCVCECASQHIYTSLSSWAVREAL